MDMLNGRKVGAEIGVRKAEFSKIILEHADPERLYLVDAWDETTEQPYSIPQKRHNLFKAIAKDNMQEFVDVGRVMILEGFSKEVACRIDDAELDWVYIDAGHSYEDCLEDLRIWWPKVRAGGIIAGHDYVSGVPGVGVVRAVADFMSEHGITELGLTSGKQERAKSFWFEKE
jgi:hypothetical protein